MQRDAIDVAVLSAERVPRDLPAEVLGIDELVVVESALHPVSSEGSMTFSEPALAPATSLWT